MQDDTLHAVSGGSVWQRAGQITWPDDETSSWLKRPLTANRDKVSSYLQDATCGNFKAANQSAQQYLNDA